jgi:prepilin peptidase CpaA
MSQFVSSMILDALKTSVSQSHRDVLNHSEESEVQKPATPMPQMAWADAWITIGACSAVATAIAMVWPAPGRLGVFLPVLTLAICILAAWTDAASSRIPNAITYPAVIVGLALNCWPALYPANILPITRWAGSVGMIESLEGVGLSFAIGLSCWIFRGIGGGDLKLLTALGALCGFSRMLPILMLLVTCALLYALVDLLFLGALSRLAQILAKLIFNQFGTSPPDPIFGNGPRVPMAVPALLAVLLWQLLPPEFLNRMLGI